MRPLRTANPTGERAERWNLIDKKVLGFDVGHIVAGVSIDEMDHQRTSRAEPQAALGDVTSEAF